MTNLQDNDMDDALESLGSSLEGFKVDQESLGEHPRFSQYKNLTRAQESQSKRREDALKRQKEARDDKLQQIRDICNEEEDEEMQVERQKRRYEGVLMTSEWLVDIPTDSIHTWMALLCPIGKRVLVVASRGVTRVYNKAGHTLKQFTSNLPGGNKQNRGSRCVLDCIWQQDKQRFHILDGIQWGEHEFCDSPFSFRSFFICSRVEEEKKFASSKPSFERVPRSAADTESLRRLIQTGIDYELDGVLFYHPEVLYISGQSPLVGWLKPWMLPEILHVPVPDKLTSGATATALAFIEKFNKEHHHSTQIKA